MTIDRGAMRRRLLKLQKITKASEQLALDVAAVGDRAGLKRAKDDFISGRSFWRWAYNYASFGLRSLDNDDLPMAEKSLWEATDYYIAALEICARPSDLENLGRSAKRRGRPLGALSKKGRSATK